MMKKPTYFSKDKYLKKICMLVSTLENAIKANEHINYNILKEIDKMMPVYLVQIEQCTQALNEKKASLIKLNQQVRYQLEYDHNFEKQLQIVEAELEFFVRSMHEENPEKNLAPLQHRIASIHQTLDLKIGV